MHCTLTISGKFTKSLLIAFTLTTILSLSLVSCKRSNKSSAARPEKVKVEKEVTKADKVISTARSYIGTPYKYGGNTRAGMDCSGLVCVSFSTVNLPLPRTCNEQSRQGKSIPRENIEKGDLLFFSDKKGGSRITHVGIVTEVRDKKNVRFIHASTRLGVVEDDLYSDYYNSIFVKAVRVL